MSCTDLHSRAWSKIFLVGPNILFGGGGEPVLGGPNYTWQVPGRYVALTVITCTPVTIFFPFGVRLAKHAHCFV